MVVPAKRIMNFSEAPIVDIGPLVRGDKAEIPDVVQNIQRACEGIGFMYVKNHGVARATLDAMVSEAKAFFDLPVDQKLSVAVEQSRQFRGYLPLEYTGNEGPEGKNLQEAFIIMHERGLDSSNLLDGPNQWPAALPTIKPAMLHYFAAMEDLAFKLLPGFALSLGLPGNYFTEAFTKPIMVLKPNHYPPQKIADETQIIGVGGHCDGGGFTILWQDNLGGLEIKNKSGEWIGVPPIKDTFVINIGNLLQRWTNGRFSSTEHRVINRFGKDRYSIAFFADPNYHTLIGPIVDKKNNDDLPIVCGEYLYKNYERIYPQRSAVS
jgi:isopenicillin N synthase-like dioxygenase